MRLFVTGATGFVGSHLIEACVRRGYPVLGSSREGRWRRGVPSFVSDAVQLLVWDVTQPASSLLVDQVRAFKPDALLHLAAISIPVDCGVGEPTQAAILTNVRGTEHALELADELPDLSSFTLTSSCHVYDCDPSRLQIVDEKWPTAPINGYGCTKLWAEQLVEQHRSKNNYRRLITRGFQQTGPWQPARLIVPEWLEMVARGDDPVRVRCLNTVLDLADIRDTVAMQLELLLREAEGIFNLASGVATRGEELIEQLQRCAGRRLRVESQQQGPRYNPVADLSLIRNTLGTIRHRPLLMTLRDMWQTLDNVKPLALADCDVSCTGIEG